MKRHILTAVVIAMAGLGHAGPDTISYQGSLLGSGGTSPIPNGTYTMQFTLYDDPTTVTPKWQETLDVHVAGGLFSAVLGETTPFSGVFLENPDLWLGVSVDLDDSGAFQPSEVFSPRCNMAGTPWANPRLRPHPESPNLIGGSIANRITRGVKGAVIAGGGRDNPAGLNQVTDHYGTVCGGEHNRAGNDNADPADAIRSFVGAGKNNVAGGAESVVVGGELNTASGVGASVGGGLGNTAEGPFATVAGGFGNHAVGDYSFAAGFMANANHPGSFVWADGALGTVESDRANQFRVEANGGVRFDVNHLDWVSIRYYEPILGTPRIISTSTDAYLSAAGVWTDISDRHVKENFTPVDSKDVLTRLDQLPVTTWNFKAEDDSVRHMGPVGQEFHAAFGLGSDDRHIASLDANGVALAAIKGLHQLMKEKDGEIAALKADNTAQQQRIAELEARLAAIEARVAE